MSWFSSKTEKSALASNPVNLDVTKQYGSGAEQDRYGAHFGAESSDKVREAARSGYDQAKDAAQKGYNQAKVSAERGYDQAKAKAEKGYSQAKATAEEGYERAKESIDKALNAKGSGAEQDLYGSHFDYNSLDLGPVTRATMSIIKKGGDLGSASRHGLGYDGWERAKILAAYKGSGSEQDHYEARFGRIGEEAAQAIKNKVNEFRK
ncbi:MAG: hypothetical protein GOMPHAMPRED_002549 [Gomphillus americanus]|uniref:Uncharacterized protein n=1 Tax=Gomphillus americanus TaxID=1940652 RepID=A0A8H3FK66_9LECA|nr:MAG: hypothetical protein GOMPHAMPRED_002549 [Gomphillus americanus]